VGAGDLDINELSGSVIHGGRISACSYRSYLSYDELAPESVLDDRLSLVSGRTSTTPGPNVALVTPNGTLYRLSDRSFHHGGTAPANGPDIVPEGQDPARDDGVPAEAGSTDLDDVFIEEDFVSAVNDDEEVSCTSVFDFAVACLRRQHPDRPALVIRTHNALCTRTCFIELSVQCDTLHGILT